MKVFPFFFSLIRFVKRKTVNSDRSHWRGVCFLPGNNNSCYYYKHHISCSTLWMFSCGHLATPPTFLFSSHSSSEKKKKKIRIQKCLDNIIPETSESNEASVWRKKAGRKVTLNNGLFGSAPANPKLGAHWIFCSGGWSVSETLPGQLWALDHMSVFPANV